MATVIKSVAISNSSGRKGIVKLVSEAAEQCLRSSSIDFGDLGMLISTGVYSENHLMEPALAALIHKELLRMNKRMGSQTKHRSGLLSFDLHNGGGGTIDALCVVDGFISSGEIEHGLILGGDVKPLSGGSGDYGYRNGAAAVLVSKDKNKKGFVRFRTETFSEFKSDFSSTTIWENGSLKLINYQSDSYLKNLLNCSEKVLDRFLKEEHLSRDAIDCIFTSQSPKGFARELQNKLHMPKKIFSLNNKEEIYSSGLIYSLNALFGKEEFKRAKNILLLTAGAGITISLAYYRNETSMSEINNLT